MTVACARGQLEVRDRGPGITADERELVFERFHRGRAGRYGPPGDGLGLPIARELAREWGGDVTLEDRAGGGTVAIITLEPDDDLNGLRIAALPALNRPEPTLPSHGSH